MFIFFFKDSVEKLDFYLSVRINIMSSIVGNYIVSDMDLLLLDILMYGFLVRLIVL